MSILRADSIRDRAGTGAPDFPNGLTGNVTGTATTATSATTATTASALGSGATGVDLTLSGNLTVNGTTTTIDTAVTSVDSLAVDGQITAGTRIGINSTTPIETLDLVASAPRIRAVAENGNSGFRINVVGGGNEVFRLQEDNNTRFEIAPGGVAIFKAGLAEKVNVKTQLTGANSTSINDGNVVLTTTAEPGNTYPNITGVHTVLSSGEGFSITIALKVNGSGTINNFYIDGVPQNIEWSGGSAPSAGSSGYDVFTFSAMKTGTGTSDYTVFGAATNYA